jgi:hypothetical protein
MSMYYTRYWKGLHQRMMITTVGGAERDDDADKQFNQDIG